MEDEKNKAMHNYLRIASEESDRLDEANFEFIDLIRRIQSMTEAGESFAHNSLYRDVVSQAKELSQKMLMRVETVDEALRDYRSLVIMK